jgi:dTDP-4-dehydrorhamnose 3,5-epimerase
MNEYALPGMKSYEMNIIPDDRGYFSEVLRLDWKEFIGEAVSQVNMSYSYPNVVRAWHRHLKGQVDYFFVISGALKICGFDDETGKLVEVIATGKKPMLLRMPGHYWHGFRALGSEPSTLVYFVNRLYDYKNPDEERRPWNDPSLIPQEINGRKDDPRVKKTWDWYYSPNK